MYLWPGFFEEDSDKDPGLFMIECNDCQKWFHKTCESTNSVYFENEARLGIAP